MKPKEAKENADMLKALGHPIRVRILDALSQGDACVNDLCELAPVCQATLSRHLAWLKRVGLVTEERAGPRVIHHLACPGILKAVTAAEEAVRTVKRRS